MGGLEIMKQTKKVSIIIPCYNEEAVLPTLFERMNAVMDAWDYETEILCVDDGSKDGTWRMLQEYCEADRRWRAISFSRNFGHQVAVSAGMAHAVGDCACVIDADLQDPPEVLHEFAKEWENGYQVVYGVRKKRKDKKIKKWIAWCFYRVMARLSSVEIPPDSGDFCLIDRQVLDVMVSLPERNRYLRGLRVWCGYKQKAVTFERDARAAGEPQYTFRKSLKLGLDGIFSFSAVPLSLASHVGLWISITAFLGAVFTFLQRIFPAFFARFGLAPGPGFATIVISLLFLGGIQLICLGILGEYLGRIYEEIKGRPNWIISEYANVSKNDQ